MEDDFIIEKCVNNILNLEQNHPVKIILFHHVVLSLITNSVTAMLYGGEVGTLNIVNGVY